MSLSGWNWSRCRSASARRACVAATTGALTARADGATANARVQTRRVVAHDDQRGDAALGRNVHDDAETLGWSGQSERGDPARPRSARCHEGRRRSWDHP